MTANDATEQAYRNGFRKGLSLAVLVYEPIEALDVTVRTYNCCKRFGIHTVRELYDFHLDHYKNGGIKMIRNMGNKSVFELDTILSRKGLPSLDEYAEMMNEQMREGDAK